MPRKKQKDLLHSDFVSVQKVLLMTFAVTLTLFLTIFLIVKSVTEIRQTESMTSGGTITVTGEAEVFAVPDIASFSYSIIEKAENPGDAQSVVSGVNDEALEIVKSYGIKDEDIKTQSLNVYPIYVFVPEFCPEDEDEPCEPGYEEIDGYEANIAVDVKVREIKDASRLIADLAELDIDRVSDLNFTIDDEEYYKEQARGKAIADAQMKAQTLANQLGVKLSKIVYFEDSVYPRYGRGFEIAEFDTFETAIPKVADLQPGENQITSQVSITYEIR